ncbi:speckle-type POZ protein B [Nephila pilipes]|uniref:Speckle-type POZ protein B n=1 Tax=Nephila pilipes TaxID=299642 RepID=A0A8X6MPP3_NEPPI|nr:speckle-type POZ protein B [Nephila pilipes]
MDSEAVAEKDGCVTFYWNIDNYSYCWHKRREGIYSPDFVVNSMENTQWTLLLYPKGSTEGNYIDYFLGRTSEDGPKCITVKCELAFLAEDGSVLLTKERERDTYTNGTYWGFEKFAKREELLSTKRNYFLPQDVLRARCRLWRTDGKPLRPITFHARTTLNVEKRNFYWDIGNFSTNDFGRKITFPIGPDWDETLISLIFLVNSWLKKILSSGEKESLIFQLFILDTTGIELYCDQKEFLFNDFRSCSYYSLLFIKTFFMENHYLYLTNNFLYMRCEYGFPLRTDFKKIDRIDIGISYPRVLNVILINKQGESFKKDELETAVSLKKDLASFYSKGILFDTRLNTTTETFHAHKVILCSRSPVFQAMFTSNMKEKTQESVDVPDLEDNIMRRMLLYMYTDSLKDLQWESAMNLYSAADKYEILSLKDKCSFFLKSNLCPTKVCEILTLADRHMDSDLKEAVQHYTLTHDDDVFHSDEWTEFTRTNTALAAETMLLKWKK